MTELLLDLMEIERCLRCYRDHTEHLNAALGLDLALIEEREICNMMQGYALLDEMVSTGIDVFAPGNSTYLLELNARILCGIDPKERRVHAGHLAATEARFYDHAGGGIGALTEWIKLNRGADTWDRAAGAFAAIVGEPQLFIEGNHRTGMLIMNYVLLWDAEPPFIICGETASRFFSLAAEIIRVREQSFAWRLLGVEPAQQKALANLLREETAKSAHFLLNPLPNVRKS